MNAPWLTFSSLALAAFGGLTSGFARCEPAFGWLVCLCVLPVSATIMRLDACGRPRRRLLALGSGFAFGAAENVLMLWELPAAVSGYFGLGPSRSLLAALLLGCFHAIRPAIWAACLSEARVRGVNFAWAASVGYVALSAALPRVGEDQLAAGLVDVPLLSALPALGGALVSDFVLVGLQTLSLSLLWQHRGRAWKARWSAEQGMIASLALCLLASGGFVLLRELRTEPGEPLRLAVVQPHRKPHDADEKRADSVLAALTELALSRSKAQLVVWPESALAGLLPPDPRARVAQRLAHITVPHIVGADLSMSTSDAIYGSALLVGEGGVLRQRYDKKGLMPFAELFPLLSLIPEGLVKRWQLPHAVPGETKAMFDVAGVRYGVLICYEDLLAGHLYREFHEDVPDVLVSLVNDGWFGETNLARKHEAHARLRAVEWARPLVRVTQSGVTAWFGPDGARGAELPLFQPASATFEVPRAILPTPFSWLGPWPGPAAWLAVIVWVGRRLRESRKRS